MFTERRPIHIAPSDADATKPAGLPAVSYRLRRGKKHHASFFCANPAPRAVSLPRSCAYHKCMLRYLGAIVILASLMPFLGCSRGPSKLARPDIEENTDLADSKRDPVRECFENYKKAMGKGQEILKWTDSSTLPWFQDALDAARSTKMNREELNKLKLAKRLFVVHLRHKFSAAKLKDMTAASALETYASDAKSSVARIKLGIIEVEDDDTALATPLGQRKEPDWSFSKVNGNWKVNFEASMDLYSDTLKSGFRQEHTTEEDGIIKLIHGVTGKEVDPKLFNGPPE
jgi:hypothetical protein